MVDVTFGDYLPDQPNHIAPGLATISNAYPGQNGYRPVGAYAQLQSALPAPCLGAASFVSPRGTSSIIAGTATKLYRASGSGWTEISSGYNVDYGGRWRFAQFGGLAVATDQTDNMLKVDLESGAVNLLAGAPPKVQMLGVVQNFLVGGIVNGDISRIAWSGENNAEYWQFGSRKSDYNIYPDGGSVTGIIGGEYGLILQRGAIRRMTYVGGNILFRMDKISSNIGCTTVHSVAQYGELGFWYSDNGFKMWDGAQVVPIGYEKVDTTFAAQYGAVNWPTMSTAIDGARNIVAWSMGDKIWVYNWVLQQWSIIDVAAQILLSGFTRSINIDEQDPVVGVPDDNLDGAGLLSFDHPRFKGGDPRFYVFSSDSSLGVFSGTNLAASFGMRNMELIKGRDTRVRRARPMTDATAGLTLTLEGRQRLGDVGTTRAVTTLQTTGEMPVRSRGRFIKATLAIGAGQSWNYAQGLDLTLAPGGRR